MVVLTRCTLFSSRTFRLYNHQSRNVISVDRPLCVHIIFRGAPWECSRKVRCINSVIVGRLPSDRDLDNRYDEQGASVIRVTAAIVPLIYGPHPERWAS